MVIVCVKSACGAMVIVVWNETGDSILVPRRDCISNVVDDTLGKVLHPAILPPTMDKYLGTRAPVAVGLGKGKL